MNFTRVGVLALKEWKEISRDHLLMILSFLVPVFLMIMLGFGVSLDVEHVPLVVVDQDNSAASRAYTSAFIESRYFDYRGTTFDRTELKRIIDNGDARVAIIVPPDFSSRLHSGRSGRVQVIVDGTFPFRAMIVKSYVNAIHLRQVQNNLMSLLRAQGDTNQMPVMNTDALRIELRYLFNPALKSAYSIAPKLLMVILMVTPPFLTVLGIVREKERGSIFNIYSSPVTRGEFIIGKLAPYIGISIFNMLVLWGMAVYVFGAPFNGNVLIFLLGTLLYVMCTTGIGLLISILVSTQVAAMAVTAVITVIPSLLYSGFIVPVSSLSSMAQWIAHVLPAMYYADIITGCFLKGRGATTFWLDFAALCGFISVLFTIGFMNFSKRPDE